MVSNASPSPSGLAQAMSFDCLGFLPGDDVIQAMELQLMKRWGLSLDLHGPESKPEQVKTEEQTQQNSPVGNNQDQEAKQCAYGGVEGTSPCEVSSGNAQFENPNTTSNRLPCPEEVLGLPDGVDPVQPSSDRAQSMSSDEEPFLIGLKEEGPTLNMDKNGEMLEHESSSNPSRVEKEEPEVDIDTNSNFQALYSDAKFAFNQRKYCDSLVSLDGALNLVNGDDKQANLLPELLVFRAKLLMEMGDHQEALRCLDKIKICDRSEDAWIEGAKALSKLELHVMSEVWLKTGLLRSVQTSADQQKTCSQRLAFMLQAIRSSRIYNPLVKGLQVEVRFTESGRDVRAVDKLSKGDTIFTEVPEISDQSISSHRLTACDHCGRSLVRPEDVFTKEHLNCAELQKAVRKLWPKAAVVSCGTCDRVMYCGESCRLEAWTSYHRAMCPSSPESTAAMLYDVRKSFRDVIASDGSSWQGWWNNEFSPTMMAKVWAAILCHGRQLAASDGRQSAEKSDWFTAASQFEKYTTCRNETATNTIPKMYDLLVCHFKRNKLQRYDISEKNFNRKYLQIATNYIAFHDPVDPLRLFVDKVAKDKKMYKRISKYLKEPLPSAECHGLFPLASCLNHSCKPNAKVESSRVSGRPGLMVVALDDIPTGEEIRISYVNTALERKDRQHTIWKRYGFVCQCLRCQHEGDFPNICTYCGMRAGSGHLIGHSEIPQDVTKEDAEPAVARELNPAVSDCKIETDTSSVHTQGAIQKFPTCSRCKRAWYCSEKCQKEAWKKGHKKICVKL